MSEQTETFKVGDRVNYVDPVSYGAAGYVPGTILRATGDTSARVLWDDGEEATETVDTLRPYREPARAIPAEDDRVIALWDDSLRGRVVRRELSRECCLYVEWRDVDNGGEYAGEDWVHPDAVGRFQRGWLTGEPSWELPDGNAYMPDV